MLISPPSPRPWARPTTGRCTPIPWPSWATAPSEKFIEGLASLTGYSAGSFDTLRHPLRRRPPPHGQALRRSGHPGADPVPRVHHRDDGAPTCSSRRAVGLSRRALAQTSWRQPCRPIGRPRDANGPGRWRNAARAIRDPWNRASRSDACPQWGHTQCHRGPPVARKSGAAARGHASESAFRNMREPVMDRDWGTVE